jgi:long-subunit acyl-CoA synthetase (AMP-forming)
MISHANFLALLGSLCIHSLNCFNETDSYVSFLPLPHLLERSVLFVIIFRGAFFA